jgi:hypothetical protein
MRNGHRTVPLARLAAIALVTSVVAGPVPAVNALPVPPGTATVAAARPGSSASTPASRGTQAALPASSTALASRFPGDPGLDKIWLGLNDDSADPNVEAHLPFPLGVRPGTRQSHELRL